MFLTILIALFVIWLLIQVAIAVYETSPKHRQDDIRFQQREQEREAMRLASKQN